MEQAPFLSGILPANGKATPDAISRRRKLAEAMMQTGMDAGPVGSWTQGAAKLANALMGGVNMRRADEAEAQGQQSAQEKLMAALSGGGDEALIGAMNDPWMSSANQDLLTSQYAKAHKPPAPPELKDMGHGQFFQYDPANPQGGQMFTPEGYSEPPDRTARPAAIQEYEYAVGQGFKGTYQDWEASKKGGMSLQVDPATGQVTFQQGGNIKPMTEAQSKDTVFATRAEGALQLLDSATDPLANNLTEMGGSTVGQIPLVGNFMKSDGYQQAEQAGNEFLQAILRKDTGAAITPGEQALYGGTYLPKPGDGPEVLVQKQASRRRAVDALKAGMTPQAILAQERALQQTQPQPVPQPDASAPIDLKSKYGLE
jgi:hypothetical protein